MCIFLCVRDMVFTFMHLADAFIQSDLHSVYTFFLSVFCGMQQAFPFILHFKVYVISIFCKHNWYKFVIYVFSIL